MKKRILSILGAICLLLSALPVPGRAAGPELLDKETEITWTATRLNGETVDQDTRKGQIQVLIFFNISGGDLNSLQALETAAAAPWAELPEVHVTAVGCDGSGVTATAEHLRIFMDANGFRETENMTFAWMPFSSGPAVRYLREAGTEEEFAFPGNVILSGDGRLQAAWMGECAPLRYGEVLTGLGLENAENDPCHTLAFQGSADYDSAFRELELLNEYRESRGLNGLTMDAGLLEAAMLRAAETAVYFDHIRPDGSSFLTAETGEVRPAAEIRAVSREDPGAVAEGWKAEKESERQLLEETYRSVGIGCFLTPEGDRCWVQLFSGDPGTAPEEVPSGCRETRWEIPARRAFLELRTLPVSLKLKPEEQETVRLYCANRKLRTLSLPVEIGSWSISGDPEDPPAQAAQNEDGSVTVTGKKEGTAVLELKVSGLTVTVPVSVEEERGKDPEPPALPEFTDVSEKAYYYNAVRWAAAEEIAKGITATAFQPGGPCTRAQAVTFLWRAAGRPEPKNSSGKFTDVKAGSYYETAVWWAVEQGITAGTSAGAFQPDRPCTRGEIVTFQYRAAGSPGITGANPFRDAASGYYADAVCWAVEQGVTRGTAPGIFSPRRPCTRGEIVTFLYRARDIS